jgi:hypothetical protein
MKQEAWKSIVGFCEKLFLLSFGALIVPVVIGKTTYPILAIILGGLIGVTSLSIWLYFVLKNYLKEK